MRIILLSFSITLSAVSVSSFPNGAPGCMSSPVGHLGGVVPQTEPHELKFQREYDSENNSYKLTVKSKFPFKGILIMTKTPGKMAGKGLQELECVDGGVGATHTDSGEKTSVTVTLEKDDESDTSDPEFEIILVKDFATYWNGIKA